MLGRAKIDEDVTMTAPTTFTVLAETAGAERLGLKFTVEEEGGMFVEAEALLTFSHSVGAASVEFTLLLDGADLGVGVEGMLTHGLATGDTANKPLHFRHLLQLGKGEHKLELALKTASGNVLLPGANWPSYLTVKRTSHDAVLAQGVNAKNDDIY